LKTPPAAAPNKIIGLLLSVAALGLLAGGCSTYQQQGSAINSNWQQGNLTNAVLEATNKAQDNANNKDAIIWRLEQAAILRANGQYDDSNKAFDLAQEKIDQYEQDAKVNVVREAGALMSNQAELPYQGRAYDGIMLNTYKALNYLALGEPDKARPEIIRAYQRQQDAVEENKQLIEKVQDQANSDSNSKAITAAENDPKFQALMQDANYSKLDSLKGYADYVNPFTVYLDGLFFMTNSADASDLDRAHTSFERVNAFIGDNDYIKQDLATVNDLIGGKPLSPTTYVIFETGCAPVRDQVRIDIPIIVSRVSYVGAAFPTLKIQGNYISGLTVTANGVSSPTTLLSSMDGVIGLDFKNELPIIITKTIAATAAKAIAAYAVNNAMQQQDAMVGLFSQIATAAYQAAVNVADERTWTTLPKEFQFCRIPTPPDRKIDLVSAGGLQTIPVTIADGTVNIVYVRSINAATPLLVSQMKLK